MHILLKYGKVGGRRIFREFVEKRNYWDAFGDGIYLF